MNTLTLPVSNNLIDAVFRHGIGALDARFFERLSDNKSNFPPHNIIQLSEDKFRLVLAVAGFTNAELDITLHDDVLTVSGQKTQPLYSDNSVLLHNGIAFRDFSRQFKVGENIVIDNAELKNGLLQIDLSRHLPASKTPKKIAIG